LKGKNNVTEEERDQGTKLNKDAKPEPKGKTPSSGGRDCHAYLLGKNRSPGPKG